ncbi:DUF4913 domain-containing protein, partial [Rhodococcus marinonascens]|uniref:DUF4913 domain-containing protein n=1 Tax=Rhodococcus marinonascens TaxID=38311 RepID=UPI001114753F
WYAWEEARVCDKASAMSYWWTNHLEPHLRVILDSETGPMAHAKSDGSFSGWPALPHQPVPTELLPRTPRRLSTTPALHLRSRSRTTRHGIRKPQAARGRVHLPRPPL